MDSIVELDDEGLHANEIMCTIQYLDAKEANRFCELYLKILVVEIRDMVKTDRRILHIGKVDKQDENEFIRLRKKSVDNRRKEIKKAYDDITTD